MAEEVRTEIAGRVLTLTNLDKVLYPAHGFTKAEVIDYYLRIAPVMLPHLADRVITRLRFPDGTAAQPFFEKNAPAGLPPWVRTCTVLGADTSVAYLLVDEVATLVLLANYAALELHTPQWRVPPEATEVELNPQAPAAWVMLDLDPGEGVGMQTIARAALMLAAELAADGLIPHVKTTGSKGLQVNAAIVPRPATEVTEYVRRLGVRMEQRHPDLFLISQNREQRTNRILIDVMQNYAARNTISAYSLRGRATPTVATPLTWDEVAAAAAGAPLSFTADQVLERVDRHGDLAAGLLGADRGTLPGDP